MNLRELQSAFARLATDDDYRQAAMQSGNAAMTDSLEGAVARLAADRGVAQHAATLKRKRLLAVRSRLPATAAAMSARFEPCFMVFAGMHPLTDGPRYDRDALQFLEWLNGIDNGKCVGVNRNGQARCDSLSESMRFERLELRARLSRYLCRVALIDARLLKDRRGLPAARCVCIWFRASPRHVVRRWSLRIGRLSARNSEPMALTD